MLNSYDDHVSSKNDILPLAWEPNTCESSTYVVGCGRMSHHIELNVNPAVAGAGDILMGVGRHRTRDERGLKSEGFECSMIRKVESRFGFGTALLGFVSISSAELGMVSVGTEL